MSQPPRPRLPEPAEAAYRAAAELPAASWNRRTFWANPVVQQNVCRAALAQGRKSR